MLRSSLAAALTFSLLTTAFQVQASPLDDVLIPATQRQLPAFLGSDQLAPAALVAVAQQIQSMNSSEFEAWRTGVVSALQGLDPEHVARRLLDSLSFRSRLKLAAQYDIDLQDLRARVATDVAVHIEQGVHQLNSLDRDTLLTSLEGLQGGPSGPVKAPNLLHCAGEALGGIAGWMLLGTGTIGTAFSPLYFLAPAMALLWLETPPQIATELYRCATGGGGK